MYIHIPRVSISEYESWEKYVISAKLVAKRFNIKSF